MTREEYLDNLTYKEVKEIIDEGLFWLFDIPDNVTVDDIIKWIKKYT